LISPPLPEYLDNFSVLTATCIHYRPLRVSI
jgi:hypothetical protein